MIKTFLICFIAFLFTSCNSCCNNPNLFENEDNSEKIFGSVQPPKNCEKECKKQFVYDLMHDSYLWADETIILSEDQILDISDDKEMLEILKTPKDKFSYILTKKEHDNYFQAGVDTGFGFFPSFVEDSESGKLFIGIILVYPDSPADKVGLKRGDYISMIDDISIEDIYQSRELIEYYFGDKEENLTMSLKLETSQEINISKSEFKVKTVLHKSVIEQNSLKIGYLVFQSFIGTSVEELDKSFTDFKDAGVDELVLDLRYNGGGYVFVAKYLSSLIGGENLIGKVFNKTIFNQKYSSYNSIDYFSNVPSNSLNLSRIFVITTSSSCSASELIINALRANENSVEVIQIGSSTCGKPYGMIGGAYGDNYIFPVQMKSVNGDGIGDYVDGLIPTCESNDDFNFNFGNINENSLSTALFYIENDSCKRRSRNIFLKRENVIEGFRGVHGLF